MVYRTTREATEAHMRHLDILADRAADFLLQDVRVTTASRIIAKLGLEISPTALGRMLVRHPLVVVVRPRRPGVPALFGHKYHKHLIQLETEHVAQRMARLRELNDMTQRVITYLHQAGHVYDAATLVKNLKLPLAPYILAQRLSQRPEIWIVRHPAPKAPGLYAHAQYRPQHATGGVSV